MSCQPDVFELVRNRIGFVLAELIRESFRSFLRLARNQRSRLARKGYGLDWLESRPPHGKKSRGSRAAAHIIRLRIWTHRAESARAMITNTELSLCAQPGRLKIQVHSRP